MREDGSDRASLAMPLGVCAVVAAVLALVAIAGASRAEPAASEPPGARAAASSGPVTPVATVARRVEAIRGLTFREMPEPKTVTKAQARREGLADLDRSYPTAERRADEELYKLLGLLAPRDDFREIFASIFGDQVAGYYDPRSGALRIVEGGAATNRVLDETTVAHELTHALEDQRFGLDLDDSGTSGDVPLAYTAMVEGTATALMTEYQRRHFGREEALGAAAAGALAAPSTQALPPFVTAQLLFPYVEGERFISRLYATARDSWRLVDLAERVRPPVSTEQILHPEKYLAVEAPERVRLPGVRRVLREAGGGGRLAPGRGRLLRRVADPRVARARRRHRGRRGRRGLGRGPLRALAPRADRGRGLPGALRRARRARDALDVGHRARRRRVPRGARRGARAGPRRAPPARRPG